MEDALREMMSSTNHLEFSRKLRWLMKNDEISKKWDFRTESVLWWKCMGLKWKWLVTVVPSSLLHCFMPSPSSLFFSPSLLPFFTPSLTSQWRDRDREREWIHSPKTDQTIWWNEKGEITTDYVTTGQFWKMEGKSEENYNTTVSWMIAISETLKSPILSQHL